MAQDWFLCDVIVEEVGERGRRREEREDEGILFWDLTPGMGIWAYRVAG